MVPRWIRGDMLRHNGGTAFYTKNDTGAAPESVRVLFEEPKHQGDVEGLSHFVV
jgi:hypothetical protein